MSASSRTISFLPPSEDLVKEPSSLKVSNLDPLSATSSIALPVRWSEAFISMMLHPISRASASTEVVLPTPGGPLRTATLTSGMPFSQLRAQALRLFTAVGFPTTPSRV